MTCNRFSVHLRIGLFFSFFFTKQQTMSLVQWPCQWTTRLAIFSFHTESVSRSIKHAYSTLSTARTGHQNGSERYAQRPSGRNSVYFAVGGENSKNAKHAFWMMISHDGQQIEKGNSETLISLMPIKTAPGPERTQYRFPPQLQLLTKASIRISLFLRPPHLLARLSKRFYDCGITLTCLTLPTISPPCD